MQKILCRLIIIMCALLFGAAYACDTNQIDVLGDGTNCIDTKFSLTTTSLTLPDESEFRWYMSASGTFYVDCGTDGTLSGTGVVGKTIARTNTTEALYTCTYTSGGTKTIQMAGLATGYNGTIGGYNRVYSTIRFSSVEGSDLSTPLLVNDISGSLGQIFQTLGTAENQQPAFLATFAYTRITTIPENLFSGVYGGANSMFRYTFIACRRLTSIPENLFVGITGGTYKLFDRTFQGCSSITLIPENLFQDVIYSYGDEFFQTFGACSSLQTIPENLFASITNWSAIGYMFYYTFHGCTSLTQLPNNLFKNVPRAVSNVFNGAFANCTGLTGYIPPSMFETLIKNGAPYDTSMMSSIFYNTGSLATTCPPGTTQYITGYEDYWNGHVSCVPEQFTCAAGKYLPAHGYQCEDCPANDYCVGGTYNYSESNDNGANACPTGHSSSTGASQCSANEITINWDDGNGGADTTTCTYGGTITTPTVAPTKRGHTFLGWRFVAPSGN